jgi:DNA-binding NarL/FixJ family response regulator
MKKKTRILVIDDHSMMRLALAEAIAHESDLTLVGEAANADQALKQYRELKPDVVTMDFQLPDISGPELTAQIRADFPAARILMLSIFEGEEDIWQASQAGAVGYVPKSIEISQMLDAIREVAAGRSYFPATIAQRLDARHARETLTPRELQVLRHIVAGRSNKEIMSDLSLSEGTVKLHVSNILSKLEVLDRTQAAVQAVRRGIVHLD